MVLSNASQAAPDKWEYAIVETYVRRGKTTEQQYGVELRLHRQNPIFLPYSKTSKSDEFFLDVLNRLGSKGWELTNSPGRTGDNRYFLKRRK